MPVRTSVLVPTKVIINAIAPERKNMAEYVVINEETCTGCRKCVDMCPQKILYIDEKTKKCKVTDASKCDRLGGCEFVCKSKSIKIS